jgi:hypothetical protein
VPLAEYGKLPRSKSGSVAIGRCSPNSRESLTQTYRKVSPELGALNVSTVHPGREAAS